MEEKRQLIVDGTAKNCLQWLGECGVGVGGLLQCVVGRASPEVLSSFNREE